MTLKANGVALAAPTSISVNDEIIWSSTSGRASDGTMLGDVIAEKKNISITWEFLTAAQVLVISENVKAGFFEFEFEDEGGLIKITCYRGTTTKEQLGRLDDGILWYRSVKSSMIHK